MITALRLRSGFLLCNDMCFNLQDEAVGLSSAPCHQHTASGGCQKKNMVGYSAGCRDKAWSVNQLGRIARLHHQPEACVQIINTLYGFNAMEVQEAFVKVLLVLLLPLPLPLLFCTFLMLLRQVIA